MTLDDSAEHDNQRPALRVVRDAHRPSISAAEAGRQIGRSRFWVTEQIQNGGLDGYGVKGPHRTRWYVYSDALPDAQGTSGRIAAGSRRATPEVMQIATELLDALYEERRHRVDAFGLVHGALDEMTRAFVAAREGATEDAGDQAVEAQDTAAQGRVADVEAQRAADKTNRLLNQLTIQLSRSAHVDGVAHDDTG